MMGLLETLKDSAESTFDSAVHHVENVHQLIGGYVGDKTRRLSRGRRPQSSNERVSASSIYDVVRGVNREIGEFGTDVFEIVEDARARQTVERDAEEKNDDR